MVLNNINKNDSILLEVLASVFTVSSNFTDNPRIVLDLNAQAGRKLWSEIERAHLHFMIQEPMWKFRK